MHSYGVKVTNMRLGYFYWMLTVGLAECAARAVSLLSLGFRMSLAFINLIIVFFTGWGGNHDNNKKS